MDKTNKISSFLNNDTSYLLGLMIGRGTFNRREDLKQVIIDFPFKNLEAEGYKFKYDTQLYLTNSLDIIIRRLKRIGLDVEKISDEDNKSVSLIIEWNKDDISWQFIEYMLNEEFTNYHSFRIPKAIFKADKENEKEFLRGYFDVTGHIRKSNKAYGNEDQHRIYLEIDFQNWFLVVDLCRLLRNLNIPIQTIDFAHPNFRDPKAKKKPGFWAKEHQLKIYANQFLPIGSYLKHKQKVLENLASYNKSDLGSKKVKSKIRFKPANPEENSEKLPKFLRGKHFDHFTQLLNYLIRINKKQNG